MLLEKGGADCAVRLGSPGVWMEAVAGLGAEAEISDGAGIDADLRAGAALLPTEARLCAGLLARFMSDLSEDYWAAGWLVGLEFELCTAIGGRRAVSIRQPPRARQISRRSAATGSSGQTRGCDTFLEEWPGTL